MRRILVIVGFLSSMSSVHAERINNPIAVFAGLDKITGITTAFEVKIGEEKQFGALVVKPDICYSREITDEPKTSSFVEVDERNADGIRKRIFTGWMFAESPGLNAVEHPVYDVWLTGCRDPNAPPVQVEQTPEPPPSALQDDEDKAED